MSSWGPSQFNQPYNQASFNYQGQAAGNYHPGGGYSHQPFGQGPPNIPPPSVNPELWQWFQAVDQDRNGRITIEELQQALMNGNWAPFNEETCRLMVGMFDKDHSGTIDIREFEALWKYIQEWKRCFDTFDNDRSGTIDVNELSSAFHTFGYRLSQEFTNTVIRRFDRYGRNAINFDDFIQACVMLHILTDAFRMKDTARAGVIRISYEEFLKMVMDSTVR